MLTEEIPSRKVSCKLIQIFFFKIMLVLACLSPSGIILARTLSF